VVNHHETISWGLINRYGYVGPWCVGAVHVDLCAAQAHKSDHTQYLSHANLTMFTSLAACFTACRSDLARSCCPRLACTTPDQAVFVTGQHHDFLVSARLQVSLGTQLLSKVGMCGPYAPLTNILPLISVSWCALQQKPKEEISHVLTQHCCVFCLTR
jgi:hypothetical protein